MKNGRIICKGEIKYANGNIYNGDIYDQFNGEGTFTKVNGEVLIGTWNGGELYTGFIKNSNDKILKYLLFEKYLKFLS